MRVLFVAIAVLSIGFLGFVPMLRLALTTRSKVNWRVFIAVAAVQLVCWIGIFSDPGAEEFTSWYGNGGMGLMLINMAVSVTYYLIADIRFHGHRTQQAATASLMYGAPPVGTPYGYPPQAPAQPYMPQPQPQAPMHAMPTQAAGPAPTPTPTPATAPTPAPPAAPQSQPGPPHRIDQVRAELDELSDYLRKQDGGR
ncbi:hypothetical protein AB0J38_20860 [Streptomyces sp. NPDC050095]|uniref:hypothetical protein n=1 Tax=unclassified Streptomyces TaxID=2593676 RepID=UPI0034344E07